MLVFDETSIKRVTSGNCQQILPAPCITWRMLIHPRSTPLTPPPVPQTNTTGCSSVANASRKQRSYTTVSNSKSWAAAPNATKKLTGKVAAGIAKCQKECNRLAKQKPRGKEAPLGCEAFSISMRMTRNVYGRSKLMRTCNLFAAAPNHTCGMDWSDGDYELCTLGSQGSMQVATGC